jgi:ribose transport system ATP-binding protein
MEKDTSLKQKRSAEQLLLHMQQINKAFPGVQALQDVDLEVRPGEILALVGENGAGKSTLMKILSGVYRADSGQIRWQDQTITIHSPHDAQTHGISMIHQELALISHLDAGKNIFLGREPELLPGIIDWKTLYKNAEQELAQLSLDLPVRTPVRFFPIAQQQMIEVAKALSLDAKLIVMDEPTSSLADREVVTLFEKMRALKERGVGIVFISHRMNEIFEIADRVTVLRDGQFVGTHRIADLQPEDVIRMMVGREVEQIFEPRTTPPSQEIALEVTNLSRGQVIQDINFKLHKGEVLGIAGLVGAGRTELAETLFGIHPANAGTILLEGQPINIRRPSQAIRNGIGLVPEDRKRQGLFLRMSVAANVVMAMLKRLARLFFVPWAKVNTITEDFVERLDIRTPSNQQVVQNLSGGNQQKVVIAKWLTLDPKVLILDEPTRGIDVGAKAEIYRLINQLAERGVAILMISSELPEVIGVSDRILVMHEGRISGEFAAETATQDQLMHAATGTQTGRTL